MSDFDSEKGEIMSFLPPEKEEIMVFLPPAKDEIMPDFAYEKDEIMAFLPSGKEEIVANFDSAKEEATPFFVPGKEEIIAGFLPGAVVSATLSCVAGVVGEKASVFLPSPTGEPIVLGGFMQCSVPCSVPVRVDEGVRSQPPDEKTEPLICEVDPRDVS